MGAIPMCHHHKPVDLIAERHADAAEDGDEDEAADADSETPTLTPPADD